MRHVMFDDGEYKIRLMLVSSLEEYKAPEDEDEPCGTYQPPNGNRVATIMIRGDLPPFKLRWTLWHELLHHFEFAYDTELPDDIIDNLARFITRFLRLNRRHITWLRTPKAT